jgi:gliding motility-associated-like protein
MLSGIRQGYASHIVGGEMNYDFLGGNTYKVTLKLYRDCAGIDFDGVGGSSPLALYVFNGAGQLVDSVEVNYPGETNVPAGLNYACYQPPGNICVHEAIYVTNVDLPPNASGYHLVYQRCCRNSGILNLISPGDVGSTYTAYIPPRTNTTTNSNPRYNNFPPIFVCANVPLVFDHSATDPDGDSLVYSLCDAFDGASAPCPLFVIGQVNGGCPADPPPPPYSFVPYTSGYSGAYPMSANPALSINPVTGKLTGTPNQLGKWVVAVCVSEYRNGVLLSTNKRDFQFNVVACSSNIVAAIPTQTLFCNGFTVAFGNNSINASSYHWDFGVNSLSNDTSNLSTPVYTFPDSGIYNVTLIANPGLPCADTAYEQVKVYPLLQPDFVLPPPQCITGNNFSFNAGGAFTSDATFFWSFGNATPSTSTSPNPSNVIFSTPGMQAVTLTVSQYGCSVPINKFVQVVSTPVPAFNPDPNYCGGLQLGFINSSSNAASYIWNFGDPSSPSNTAGQQDPSHAFSDTGYYNVYLTALNSLCRDSVQTTVHIIPTLLPDFSAPSTQCISGNSFSFSAGGSYYLPEATFQWNFGNAATPATSTTSTQSGVSFALPGTYNVTLTVNQLSCSRSVVKQVIVLPEPVAAIATQPPYCGGSDFTFGNNSQNATGFVWDFGAVPGSSDTSHSQSPSYTYADTGYFTVQLTATNQGLCSNTAFYTVHVFPELAPAFTAPFKQCFNSNRFSFNAQGTFQPGAQFLWDFGSSGNPSSSTSANPSNISFTSPGTKTVKLYISQYGCKDSVMHDLRVLDEPVAAIKPQDVFCNGFTYSFGNLSQFSDAWQWDFGVTTLTNDTSYSFEPSYTYSDSGTYTVTLIASSEGICFDTTTALFRIYPLLEPSINVDDDQQCVNSNVFNFSVGGTYSPLTTFQWVFGTAATPDSSTLRYPLPVVFSDPGDYTVLLYAVDNGCNKQVQRTVHVYPMPTIDFDVSATGCAPLTVSFHDLSTAATPIFYDWNFGDESHSPAMNPKHSYLNAGTYDVSLTIRTDSGCVDTLTLQKPAAIIVHQSPMAGFDLDSLASLQVNPTVVITDHSLFGDFCEFTFGDGHTSHMCDTTYTFADTGTYQITQIVTTAEGCVDTSIRIVRIPPTFSFYISNAFSPNGDGLNDVFLPVVIGAKQMQFDVYDRWGEMIFEGAVGQGWDGRYKGRAVQEDVYVYRIKLVDVFDQPHSYTGHVTVVK